MISTGIEQDDARSIHDGGVGVDDANTKVGSESGDGKEQKQQDATDRQAILLCTRKGLMSSFTPVSWLGDFRSDDRYDCGLPMHKHSGPQRWLPSELLKEPNSLTVARQRGILTRFPVHYDLGRMPSRNLDVSEWTRERHVSKEQLALHCEEL